ncbi:MAG: DNA recombination protein RmuC [Bacteroidales bacterium]
MLTTTVLTILLLLLSLALIKLYRELTELRKKGEDQISDKQMLQSVERVLEDKERQIQNLELQLKNHYDELENKNQKITSLSTSLALALKEKQIFEEKLLTQKHEIEEMRINMTNEFKWMAQEILEEKSRKFTETNKVNIQQLLGPLAEKITEFRSQVEEAYGKEAKERFSLQSSIKELVELNSRISEEANNLSKALRGDSKIQGDWGEMILESILEKSGLRKGEGYFTQEYLKDSTNKHLFNDLGQRMRPDVIVVYPDERKVIIDSKVSLTAYLRYQEAVSAEDQAKAMADNLVSVKRHIQELSTKSYDDFNQSLDFVMMFIPNEGAYLLAMKADPSLWSYAYDRRIVLVSPTHLITALKLISDLWKREYQNRNALDIANRGGLLYDKFVTFVEHMRKIGDSLDKTQKSYDSAIRSLSDGNGNLISQAQQLKDLGVKAKKTLSVDEGV